MDFCYNNWIYYTCSKIVNVFSNEQLIWEMIPFDRRSGLEGKQGNVGIQVQGQGQGQGQGLGLGHES